MNNRIPEETNVCMETDFPHVLDDFLAAQQRVSVEIITHPIFDKLKTFHIRAVTTMWHPGGGPTSVTIHIVCEPGECDELMKICSEYGLHGFESATTAFLITLPMS